MFGIFVMNPKNTEITVKTRCVARLVLVGVSSKIKDLDTVDYFKSKNIVRIIMSHGQC